jgi:ubiquinone biosynthesis protein
MVRLLTRFSVLLASSVLHLVPAVVAALRRRDPDGVATRVNRLLVRLGPTFVKGGQLLSTRADLLTPAWCAALAGLHDRVGPMRPGALRRALAIAYPPGTPWPFAALDREPLASGSIACVYRARLHDGREAAVKVRRPGLTPVMRADFRLLAAGAGVGQRMPGLRRLPMRRMVDQIAVAVLGQLDFEQEAASLDRLRRNLDGLIHVPAPLPEASGDGVLVMELVPGLDRFGPGEMTREQRRVVVRSVLHGVYRMLFTDGLVHCDMHPGNLYLTRTGGVVLVDAGFVVQLTPRVRRLFAEFFLNMSTGRAEACAEVVLASAEQVPAGCDLDGFRAGVVRLVRDVHGRTAGQFRLAPFAARLFDLQRRSGISAAPEFVFPLLSLLVLEGMINDFDVDVDFQAEAIPTLLAELRT